jgi:hypothetical protein
MFEWRKSNDALGRVDNLVPSSVLIVLIVMGLAFGAVAG